MPYKVLAINWSKVHAKYEAIDIPRIGPACLAANVRPADIILCVRIAFGTHRCETSPLRFGHQLQHTGDNPVVPVRLIKKLPITYCIYFLVFCIPSLRVSGSFLSQQTLQYRACF